MSSNKNTNNKSTKKKITKDYDNIVDNEDQLYRDLLRDEQKNKGKKIRRSSNNFDNEDREDY